MKSVHNNKHLFSKIPSGMDVGKQKSQDFVLLVKVPILKASLLSGRPLLGRIEESVTACNEIKGYGWLLFISFIV